jgi:hypothetical protein
MVAMRTISQILAAGIAITAFALLLYSLGFNVKDRVVRSFTVILLCVLIIFTADAIGSTTTIPAEIRIWMRVQFIGLVFLPPAYFHFSDALLATTGRPSQGKRVWAVRLTYLASTVFLFLIPISDYLALVRTALPASAFFIQKSLTILFTVYYASSMIASWSIYLRAWKRTTTPTTRRRMFYLITGAIAPAVGCVPYLLSGSAFASVHNLFFWTFVMVCNFFTGGLIVMMAYSVAFFGVNWPDRVIKRRLFKWLMRGPVTAIAALGLTTILRRAVANFNLPLTEWIPISMVLTILLMEYAITVFSPYWERLFFYGKDREEIDLTTDLADRLMTRNDLREFLETVLAAISDRFRAKSAFIASLDQDDLTLIIKNGKPSIFESEDFSSKINEQIIQLSDEKNVFEWNGYHFVPLYDGEEKEGAHRLLGILGMELKTPLDMESDDRQVLLALSNRIVTALKNRELQSTVFRVVQNLSPQVEQFQMMRAQTRFANADDLAQKDYDIPVEMTNWVKDALTHFWGGPKLTESPLINLSIVQQALEDNNQSAVNALRAILRTAIERVKPEGERKFTAEWVLYNILEMKFIQGKKVREVSMRLAMSEADLYRKQRVAIEAVARTIVEMENQTSKNL